ncbi:MAG: ABC transporter ATP-binding protein [Acidimicrobiia bacterium]|nr:ABC transporter ATP-binding protein [Acidimicrobiia bacterium]
MNAKTLVTLDDVGLSIGGSVILTSAKLTVAAGEKVGLLGPNGSGKTTLLRVLATLLRPTSGTGAVLGAELGTDEIYAVRPDIVLVGHLPGLYPELTLGENLRFVARLTGRDPRRADEALAAVGLAAAADRRARDSSKGMLRRTELARALIQEPRLLLLDEAHAGLDADAIGLVDAITGRVVAAGGAALLVSHEPDRLEVDRSLRLVDGSVEEA